MYKRQVRDERAAARRWSSTSIELPVDLRWGGRITAPVNAGEGTLAQPVAGCAGPLARTVAGGQLVVVVVVSQPGRGEAGQQVVEQWVVLWVAVVVLSQLVVAGQDSR